MFVFVWRTSANAMFISASSSFARIFLYQAGSRIISARESGFRTGVRFYLQHQSSPRVMIIQEINLLYKKLFSISSLF